MKTKPAGGATYPLFFFGVGILFVGILVWVYMATRKVNPEMLDEKGQRVQVHHS